MFQRILVPLDGSARAERALPVAAKVARASGGSVILARVVSKASGLLPVIAGHTGLGQQVLVADLDEAERYLVGIATSSELEGLPIERVIRLGPTVSTLLAVAETAEADLTVMCSHGYTGVRRRIMGSVAEQLTREASVPVLVLREDGPMPGATHAEAARPLRALVPLDGSPHAKAALEPAASLHSALAGPDRGVLHLVRIVQPVAVTLEEGGMLTASAKARRYLSATAEHIREGFVAPAVAQLHLGVTWSVAVDTYVAEALLKTAEGTEIAGGGEEVFGDCDLIALATHGRNGLQRWVMGSITEQVLRNTKLPLLVVPPHSQNTSIENEEIEEEDMRTREHGRTDVFSSV